MGSSLFSIITGGAQVVNAIKMINDAMGAKNIIEAASIALDKLTEKVNKS